MNWEKLLSLKRFGDQADRKRIDQDEARLGFEVDFDRIIFSDSFRSLQDKTQVVPLSKTDFVHTRLTHSLEVSVVARSLGRMVGTYILEKYPELKEKGYRSNDFGAIVAAAALSHDIGNPPFGHSGEKSIGEFFISGKGQQFKSQLNPKQWQDLIDFEGNANGFKILCETLNNIQGGLRLSYATLGAFIKYPKESLPKKPTRHIADKKYGIFQSELPFFQELAAELGLKATGDASNSSYCRHPLAFIVEAADDICYTIIDFEDGINLGLISEDYALEYLINLVRDTINTKKYNSLQNTQDRISYLRALAIGNLIQEAARIFIENEEQILRGEFHNSLLEKCKYEAQIDDILKLSVEKIYQSKEVVEKEIAGYQVLADLLEVFLRAVNNKHDGTLSNYDKLVLMLLPDRYKQTHEDLYKRILGICNLVANFSDSYAILLHKKIKGIDLN
ncbi:deoxyguanosinetriphosphate triphosphohydrolase [Lutimonas sp.]|uniref:deoxyguanosinetriphosphate triphosphohydrolase n=1 Tax=Lutimonas sp. TaxID=1872403 RepID=UPI003D9B89EE